MRRFYKEMAKLTEDQRLKVMNYMSGGFDPYEALEHVQINYPTSIKSTEDNTEYTYVDMTMSFVGDFLARIVIQWVIMLAVAIGFSIFAPDGSSAKTFFHESIPNSIMAFGVLWTFVAVLFPGGDALDWKGTVTASFLFFLFGFCLDRNGIFTASICLGISMIIMVFASPLQYLGALLKPYLITAAALILIGFCFRGCEKPITYEEPDVSMNTRQLYQPYNYEAVC